MIKYLLPVLLSLVFYTSANAQNAVPYGNNPAAGSYAFINGVKVYYETYGDGPPLLLIHGNTTPIKGWAPQISYLAQKYKVVAMDCRGRGKTELGKDTLTYAQMAKDAAALIAYLKLDSVTVIGKSDGGIVAILMGIYHPQHLKSLVAFGANMWPDSTALYGQTVKDMQAERRHADTMLAKKDTTKNWFIERQKYRLMEFQPHITAAELHRINVPVLVMSCDRDVIKIEHTLFIYKNIPKANLSIFPGEVHRVSTLNPELFNAAIGLFLERPFRADDYRFQ